MSVSTAASVPVVYPNARRYRDTGAQPATGRAGSATLSAMALLSRDRTAELYVAAGAPATLEQVQVKHFDPDGQLRSTSNDRPGTASASYRYAGVTPGYTFQVQSAVRGADPKRTGVVTVTAPVVKRPDIAVLELTHPQEAMADLAVIVTAVVAEINGDVGANADCNLYVDGGRVDAAPDIWIDAGGTVSCAFTVVFTSAGTKRLQVRASDVTPGDWDTGNNSRSGSITVKPRNSNDYYMSASAGKQKYRSVHTWSGWWETTNGRERRAYDYTETMTLENEWAQVGGHMDTDLTLPIRVSMRHTTNGTVVQDTDVTFTRLDQTTAHGGCATYLEQHTFSDGVHPWTFYPVELRVCTHNDGTRKNHTIWSTRWVGDVTFVSAGYDRYWYDGVLDDRSYWVNRNLVAGAGELTTYGSDYNIDIRVQDAAQTYDLTAKIPLGTFQYAPVEPVDCATWNDTSTRGESCYGHDVRNVGVQGRATATPGS